MQHANHVPSEITRRLDLRAGEVDVMNRWRASAIFEAQQEMGEYHCRELHCSHAELKQKDAFFVLMRQRLDFDRYPGGAALVDATTWVAELKGLSFQRFYRFADTQGKPYGTVSTTWMLCSLSDRHILRPEEIFEDYPPPAYPPLVAPAKLRFDKEVSRSVTHQVAYSDLDYNGHANNTKYADWCCDLFPIESYAKRELASFQINYVSELRGGEVIRLDLHEQPTEFAVHGHIDGKTVFQAAGRWREYV